MSKQLIPRTLADLRSGIANGTVMCTAPRPTLAILDLAAKAVGAMRMHYPEIIRCEANFAAEFPEQPDAHHLSVFGDLELYKRCRKALFRQCRLAGLWSDPYPLLNAVAKSLNAPGINRRILEAHFPEKLPRDITRADALAVDRHLQGLERSQFRRVFALFDQIRRDERVIAAGFLDWTPIGAFPTYRNGSMLHLDLPEDLATSANTLSASHARCARRAYELAVDFGLVDLGMPANQLAITEAQARAFHTHLAKQYSQGIASKYLHTVVALIRAANPSGIPVGFEAPDITCKPRAPKSLKRPKPAPRKLPSLPKALSTALAEFAAAHRVGQQRIRQLRNRLANTWDKAGLRGEALPDDIRALFDAANPDLNEEQRASDHAMIAAFQQHLHAPCPWSLLLKRERDLSLRHVDRKGLALIKTIALSQEPALAPGEITQANAPALHAAARQRGQSTRGRLGLEALDILRDHMPDILPSPAIGALPDARKGENLDLPDALEAALREFAKSGGYTTHSVKALLVAVRKLYTLAPNRAVFDAELTCIPWQHLLNEAMARYPAQMEIYRTAIARLATRVGQNKTAGWTTLEALVVQTGVAREQNPVDRLARVAVADGLEPWHLDREWAWVHERGLRPDLRRAWSRAVALFDALNDIPEIAASGLLPPGRLGPMPVIGERLKQAEFPLPRGIDAALCGVDKQILEAAHFVWRALRHLGLYARGDNPTCAELFSDASLGRVRELQTLIGRQNAALHIDRIRDWRLSQDLTR
ncbi:hypothetical protein E4Z66_18975 [Aliishimia ponticola]|uniref:Uncharacterized protein n=1 Tax=Aliishimia ponticola TaxID=2499833 RepID=A0A4V3XJS8_9RHOB|nr:hypothetical protein [Aliishimia ponticola]THH34283.1 hypothetical protein E4Z66_18975 [Aliishimia ponticola]